MRRVYVTLEIEAIFIARCSITMLFSKPLAHAYRMFIFFKDL